MTVTINGQSSKPITVNDSSESYFKFGNYLQGQTPDTEDKLSDNDDWFDFYAEYFTESDITFTDMSYIRDGDLVGKRPLTLFNKVNGRKYYLFSNRL